MLHKIFKLLILCSLVVTFSFATSYTTKYQQAKKEYAKVIFSNNKAQEIRALKALIFYGNKLHINTIRYKKELRRLKKLPYKHTKYTKHTKKIDRIKKTKSKKPPIKIYKSKYSIKNVNDIDQQITITFNKKIYKSYIHYFTKRIGKKHQYIFDIIGRFKDASPTKLSLNGVDKIRITQYRYNTLRISFTNRKRLKLIYIIGSNKIIIKLKHKIMHIKKTYPIAKAQQNTKTIKQKTIVIDAGHGGKDSGAVGIHRYYEKRVTLNTAIHLYKILRQRGYKVYLTRARDKFISLRGRTKLANRKNADLFISIHANAVPRSKRSKVHGIETYFLSPARSKRAKRVAALENRSDMGNMGWSMQNSFLTLLNRTKIVASQKLAIDVQKNILYKLRKIYGTRAIYDGGVKEAPFWVLVGAQMPSILIEVGYITHPIEGRRIYSNKYQLNMATAIANGIDAYFLKN